MKKIYTKPQIMTVATEPATLCAASTTSWHVDHKDGHGTPDASDPNYGEIIYDKGSGSMGSDDPFDESHW